MLPPPPRLWSLGEYLARVVLPYGTGYVAGWLVRMVMRHPWIF